LSASAGPRFFCVSSPRNREFRIGDRGSTTRIKTGGLAASEMGRSVGLIRVLYHVVDQHDVLPASFFDKRRRAKRAAHIGDTDGAWRRSCASASRYANSLGKRRSRVLKGQRRFVSATRPHGCKRAEQSDRRMCSGTRPRALASRSANLWRARFRATGASSRSMGQRAMVFRLVDQMFSGSSNTPRRMIL